ncbi:MAG TPA: large conductance mechanosensitive channel protein MscL [Acidobacteriaceae bacterium]
MLKGFRDFILRGNVVDLAVAVVIGAAFSKIVGALVTDIINPLLAAIVRKPNFSYLHLHLHGADFPYGDFLNDVMNFLLVSAAVYFLVVLPINSLLKRMKRDTPAAVTTKPCPECLSEVPLAARRCSYCTQPLAAV